MSWSYIVKLALAVFVAQVAVGFLDGFLAPGGAGIVWFVGGHAVSFAACGAIFALFAMYQPFRPFAHAWIALLAHLVAGLAFAQALSPWIGSIPLAVIGLELLLVVGALIAGTAFGISLRRQASRLADA